LVRSAKHARDLRLLRQAIRGDEENVVYWTDLGRASVGVGATAGALNAWQRAIDLVRRRDGRSLAESLPYADLIQHLPRDDARRDLLLEEASTRFPENWLIVWLRAETLVARRAFADAEGLLRDLVAVDGEGTGCAGLAYDRRIFGEFAFGALATCCFELGRWAEAADWFGRAAAAQPASLEYRVKRDLTVRRRDQTGVR
jgi:tetratricopeptide (TPR) repeat protein